MVKLAHLPVLLVLMGSSCAHAAPAHDHPLVLTADATTMPGSGPKTTRYTESLLNKFTPSLRWALHDKTSGEITVLVDLKSPLPLAARSELEKQGLVFLSVGDTLLHVRGDAQALLRLAAHAEVKRLHTSGSLKPSVKDSDGAHDQR